MTFRAKTFFYFQYIVGRLAVFLTIPLIVLAIWLFRYKICEVDQVRKKVAQLFEAHKGPWLICPNHLTMIDSAILAYAMINPVKYIFQYRLLPWNMPERMNYSGNVFVVLICYLMKCIPVVRGGDRGGIRNVLGKCRYLMNRKQNLMIFPEGTRSRDGRVKTIDFPYSSGRLFLTVPGARVMCIYFRGKNQDTFSGMPRYKERFFMAVEEIFPCTSLNGLRAQRDISSQIIKHLSGMEDAYFAACGK